MKNREIDYKLQLSNEWKSKFKTIILAYHKARGPDPFMIWFRKKESEHFFSNDFERILAVLIDARFDQKTTAENALENTCTVVRCGALSKTLTNDEIPLLIPRENVTARNWTRLFCEALPRMRALSAEIVKKQSWKAFELLFFMKTDGKVPYLGIKTSRLAVRWLHELVNGISIDMSTYEIPIDSLVYRVASRLGIIDPRVDTYSGEGSPADRKIQAFVKSVMPNQPWLLDEPLWATGRKANKGGHCFPTNPRCKGCLFDEICSKLFLNVDPSKIGVSASSSGRQQARLAQSKITAKQATFRKFVDELKEKRIRGEKYREKIKQWNREHQ